MEILSAIEGGLGFSMSKQLADAGFLRGAGSWVAWGTESLSASGKLWLHVSVAVLPVGGVLILSSSRLDLSPFAQTSAKDAGVKLTLGPKCVHNAYPFNPLIPNANHKLALFFHFS
jgi:hypothetical protein